MKTTFIDGTPVLPNFLNAINNPVYKESPENNGEIPFPGNTEENPNRVLPRNNFMNGGCVCSDNSGLSTIDLTSGVGALATSRVKSAGFYVHGDTTASAIFSCSVGDPALGTKLANEVGGWTVGQQLKISLHQSYIRSGSVYGMESFGKVPGNFYATFQAIAKNNSTSGATFEVEPFDSSLDLRIAEGQAELIFKSSPQSLAPGESALVQIVAKIKQNGSYSSGELLFSPSFSFKCTSASTSRTEILYKNVGLFMGNFQGENVYMADAPYWADGQLISPESLFVAKEVAQRFEEGVFTGTYPGYYEQTGVGSDYFKTARIRVNFREKKTSSAYEVALSGMSHLNTLMNGGTTGTTATYSIESKDEYGFILKLIEDTGSASVPLAEDFFVTNLSGAWSVVLQS